MKTSLLQPPFFWLESKGPVISRLPSSPHFSSGIVEQTKHECYPMLPFFTLCYPLLPFITLCYPLLPFVTLCYPVFPSVALCYTVLL